MIVFAKVSPRRWLVLDCPNTTSGWRAIPRISGHYIDVGEGFLFGNATVIAGPADWSTCEHAAARHAQAEKTTCTGSGI
jgi:hypothetical protein